LVTPEVTPSRNLIVHVQTQNGIIISSEILDGDTVGKLKRSISVKTSIPHDHQMLKIAGKPHLDLCDYCEIISEYNKWEHTDFDMVLEEWSGEFYVIFEMGEFQQEITLKLSHNDTVKDEIFTKVKLREPKHMRLYYESNFTTYGEGNEKAFQKWLESNSEDLSYCLLFHKSTNGTQHYQLLCDNMHTIKYYNVSLFHQLLNLRICLLHNEDDGAKHVYVYSVQISDVLDASYHNPDDYLLSVEYNTTVNKLYSIVADHYKISVEHVVLMVDNYQMPDGGTQVHGMFYRPIILEDPLIYYLFSVLLSGFPACYRPEYCELAKKVIEDLILKKVVSVRNDTWVLMIKVFNITDAVRKETEENSEDDHIRCMDVMHRMYHHDNDLTWEFVEIQVRREDPQLADVIRAQL